jgi:hypothetical protein
MADGYGDVGKSTRSIYYGPRNNLQEPFFSMTGIRKRTESFRLGNLNEREEELVARAGTSDEGARRSALQRMPWRRGKVHLSGTGVVKCRILKVFPLLSCKPFVQPLRARFIIPVHTPLKMRLLLRRHCSSVLNICI